MSKKRQKTRLEKISKKHDFSHLTKTKTAAKVVEAEVQIEGETKSPHDANVRRDLRIGLIVIGVFMVLIVALWWFAGRNGEILQLANKIKFF